MFTSIKLYLSMFAGAVTLGVLAYVKYLKASNEDQKENIDRLIKEIVVRKEVVKDEKKRVAFEAKQKVRAKVLKESEITLDEIEQEIIEDEKSINDKFASDHSFSKCRV